MSSHSRLHHTYFQAYSIGYSQTTNQLLNNLDSNLLKFGRFTLDQFIRIFPNTVNRRRRCHGQKRRIFATRKLARHLLLAKWRKSAVRLDWHCNLQARDGSVGKSFFVLGTKAVRFLRRRGNPDVGGQRHSIVVYVGRVVLREKITDQSWSARAQRLNSTT